MIATINQGQIGIGELWHEICRAYSDEEEPEDLYAGKLHAALD